MKRPAASLSRRMTCVLAALLLITAVSSASAFAWKSGNTASEEVDPNWVPPAVYTSGDYDYIFNEDDGETISIADYHGKEENIIIPTELDGYAVTGIGTEAFSYVKMKSLTVPEQISSIGYRAFEYCTVSESFTLPKNIRIGMNAFAYASLPEIIIIPEGAQVGSCAFSYCKAGEIVIVCPQAVMEKRCFGYGYTLAAVVCAAGAEVEEDAFEYCRSLEQVILCGDVTLDEEAFSYCRNAKITQGGEADFARILTQLSIELPEPSPQPETKAETHTGIL